MAAEELAIYALRTQRPLVFLCTFAVSAYREEQQRLSDRHAEPLRLVHFRGLKTKKPSPRRLDMVVISNFIIPHVRGRCKMDLGEVRRARVRMDQIKEHIEVLNSAKEYGERIAHNGDGGSPTADKLPRIVARIAELTDELVSSALDYDIEVTLAERAIDELTDSEQKIARARYIDGLSWRQVAERTHFSVGHCRNANLSIVEKVNEVKYANGV